MLLLPTVYVEPAATTRVPSDHPVKVKPWRKTVEADATEKVAPVIRPTGSTGAIPNPLPVE